MVGHVVLMGKKGKAYRDLVRIPERKRPFGIIRRILEDIIKTDLQEVGLVVLSDSG
jgi:hypothetical protein